MPPYRDTLNKVSRLAENARKIKTKDFEIRPPSQIRVTVLNVMMQSGVFWKDAANFLV